MHANVDVGFFVFELVGVDFLLFTVLLGFFLARQHIACQNTKLASLKISSMSTHVISLTASVHSCIALRILTILVNKE